MRVLGFNNRRNLAALLGGDGTLGPAASIAKLYWAGWHRDLGELEMDLHGVAGLLRGDAGDDEVQKLFLLSRAETIYGGSNEIQRNTISERVLGHRC